MKSSRVAAGLSTRLTYVFAAIAIVTVAGTGCSRNSLGPLVLAKKFPGAMVPKAAGAAKSPPSVPHQ
jgi:hypothetical protein